jgi:hypothetical protein
MLDLIRKFPFLWVFGGAYHAVAIFIHCALGWRGGVCRR